MVFKLAAPEAADIAIRSIGRGYDINLDLKLEYCKGDINDPRLIEIDGEEGREIVLPGGISIPNVPKSIKCDKGEHMRFHSDVISFQQMSEQFNQELMLIGKIPSGHFNAMFEFSGSWQKDEAYTKTLAFDGVFISLYTIALEKSHTTLCDHVKKEVPSFWDPSALARFITKYGTHVIVGVKMGGKDVIYVKQRHFSSLQPDDVHKRLKDMEDNRISDAIGQSGTDSEQIYQNEKVRAKLQIRETRRRFADTGTSSNYSHTEDVVSMYKRRGGNENRKLTHQEWLQTVQLEPDVISMSFIPISSLLHGVDGSGFISHAINIYSRYKPRIEELHQFFEFQLSREWAPVFNYLESGLQRSQQRRAYLQFRFMGPRLYVDTTLVDVQKRPVTGLWLQLMGTSCNILGIRLQHLAALPKSFQQKYDPIGDSRQGFSDSRYYEKVQWKIFSNVCTAPVESDQDLSIVTGAQLLVGNYGYRKVLFLRLFFSTVVGATVVKHFEWDKSDGSSPGIGLFSQILSTHIQEKPLPPRPVDVNINSAFYPTGPPKSKAHILSNFVDTTEMKRGPQDSPGYWVVSGARLMVENGKILLNVKYSLLSAIQTDEQVSE